jgi:hypothetical membrane protein
VPARIAGICGLLAFVTATIGWVAGGFAQPAAYSVARDDISDLGAVTAASPWLYNQLGANITGLVVLICALGLWSSVGSSVLGRLGAAALAVAGVGSFLDGLFRLDCRGIDAACTNHTWHAHAHKIESGFTAAALLLAPPICAFAFRKLPQWRSAWLPSLLTLPAVIVANVVFSAVGAGAATRAGTVVALAWVAYVGAHLLAEPSAEEVPTEAPARPATP